MCEIPMRDETLFPCGCSIHLILLRPINLILLQVLMDSPKSAPPVSRTIPAPVPITNMSSSRNFRVSSAAAYSPSLGDDPWLRFM